MRVNFHTAVPAAIALLGLVGALGAPASASEVDPQSAIRGSLGVPLDDLALGSGAGATVFLLNAAFALLFAAVCIFLARADSRKREHPTFRAASRFAR